MRKLKVLFQQKTVLFFSLKEFRGMNFFTFWNVKAVILRIFLPRKTFC